MKYFAVLLGFANAGPHQGSQHQSVQMEMQGMLQSSKFVESLVTNQSKSIETTSGEHSEVQVRHQLQSDVNFLQSSVAQFGFKTVADSIGELTVQGADPETISALGAVINDTVVSLLNGSHIADVALLVAKKVGHEDACEDQQVAWTEVVARNTTMNNQRVALYAILASKLVENVSCVQLCQDMTSSLSNMPLAPPAGVVSHGCDALFVDKASAVASLRSNLPWYTWLGKELTSITTKIAKCNDCPATVSHKAELSTRRQVEFELATCSLHLELVDYLSKTKLCASTLTGTGGYIPIGEEISNRVSHRKKVYEVLQKVVCQVVTPLNTSHNLSVSSGAEFNTGVQNCQALTVDSSWLDIAQPDPPPTTTTTTVTPGRLVCISETQYPNNAAWTSCEYSQSGGLLYGVGEADIAPPDSGNVLHCPDPSKPISWIDRWCVDLAEHLAATSPLVSTECTNRSEFAKCDVACESGATGSSSVMTCSSLAEWTGGTLCEAPACTVADCNNRGTTSDLNKNNGCVCNCSDGFSGIGCSVPPSCDAAVDCTSHGTTQDTDKSNGCTCSCDAGWSGAACEDSVTDSVPLPRFDGTNCPDSGDLSSNATWMNDDLHRNNSCTSLCETKGKVCNSVSEDLQKRMCSRKALSPVAIHWKFACLHTEFRESSWDFGPFFGGRYCYFEEKLATSSNPIGASCDLVSPNYGRICACQDA